MAGGPNAQEVEAEAICGKREGVNRGRLGRRPHLPSPAALGAPPPNPGPSGAAALGSPSRHSLARSRGQGPPSPGRAPTSPARAPPRPEGPARAQAPLPWTFPRLLAVRTGPPALKPAPPAPSPLPGAGPQPHPTDLSLSCRLASPPPERAPGVAKATLSLESAPCLQLLTPGPRRPRPSRAYYPIRRGGSKPWAGGGGVFANEKPSRGGGRGGIGTSAPPNSFPAFRGGRGARDRCCSEGILSRSGDSGCGGRKGALVLGLGQGEAKAVESRREGQI